MGRARQHGRLELGEQRVTMGAVKVEQLEERIRAFAALVSEQKSYLTELDSAIGDADHGINMDRGMGAVLEKLDSTPSTTADELFKLVGLTLVSSVGGASSSSRSKRLGGLVNPRIPAITFAAARSRSSPQATWPGDSASAESKLCCASL